MSAHVEAVHLSSAYTFSKSGVECAEVVAGLGLVGDAHAGAQVRHRSRVQADPSQPNLRQVHLIHAELFDELADAGCTVHAGQLGENVTTRGVDLLGLSTGTTMRIGDDVLVAITGLRNPCHQIDNFQPGLLEHLLFRDEQLGTVRKAGVMAVVLHGGTIRTGDPIQLSPPPGTPVPLRPV